MDGWIDRYLIFNAQTVEVISTRGEKGRETEREKGRETDREKGRQTDREKKRGQRRAAEGETRWW